MSRELWAVEPCRACDAKGWFWTQSSRGPVAVDPIRCRQCDGSGGNRKLLDFDAIWTRYYETADRRFEEGLTYNELYFVVYGEKKEEE